MNREDVIAAADAYLENHWSKMVEDIARLVRIPSIEDLSQAVPGAPFGPGPAAALDEALAIARDMGFATCNVDGYMGYADLEGALAPDVQLGIIGHMDVVPAGSGWHFEPYDVSLKDGFLVGRGVLDDKGPSVCALHAMKCLKDLGDAEAAEAAETAESGLPCESAASASASAALPYTIRFLFGANEESGMNDVPYYRARYADPAFLFTPDAEFPVCHGEKGQIGVRVVSTPITDPRILELEGGQHPNAVPSTAHALVRVPEAALDDRENALPQAQNIVITWENDSIARIEATGKSAHAAMPEEGVNAIALLVDYLLEHDLCNSQERAFLSFDQKLLSATDGSGIGIATADEHFGALTIIGGTIALESGCIAQTLDCRFPTSTTADDIEAAVVALVAPIDGTVEPVRVMEPFLIQPDSPAIQALLRAYSDVTGEQARPFTMGGGTYAREFTSAASFGPEMPWLPTPSWAGGIHGPDEAVSADQLKTAFKVYVLALYDLQQLDFGK